jgi:hypothetical protein
MSSHRQSRLPRLPRLALIALMVVPPISFFAAIPWLKDQPDGVVFLFTGIAAVLVITASFALGILHHRKQDEWRRSATLFSVHWGFSAGACLVALLLVLPPFRDLIVSLAASLADAPISDDLVILAFTAGFMAVVFAQMVCIVLLSVGWTIWMSRSARDPS